MKTCSNCKSENPDDAKFCSKCGNEIIHQNVKWIDVNMVKMPTTWQKYRFIIILLSLPLDFLIIRIFLDITTSYYISESFFFGFLLPSSGISFMLLLIFSINYRYVNNTKKKQFRRAVASIEDTTDNIRLIQKSRKFGLYDWKKGEILLIPVYDFIQTQNGWYFTVQQGNQYGIYNGATRTFIVPCEYDYISPFVNGVATITKDHITKQVDTQGNIF